MPIAQDCQCLHFMLRSKSAIGGKTDLILLWLGKLSHAKMMVKLGRLPILGF